MSKRPGGSQLNTPKTWNGGTWYYCHRDTGGKFYGQYCKHKLSECQVTMKREAIHKNIDPEWR